MVRIIILQEMMTITRNMMMTEGICVADSLPGWFGTAVRRVGPGAERGESLARVLQEGELAHSAPS